MVCVSRIIPMLGLILMLVAISGTSGEECAPNTHNTCIFKCNGTTYDLSKLFDYPFNITGPYGYTYVWSPCEGMKCGSQGTDSNAAVCQSGYVDCGQNKKPVFIVQQHDPLMFSVEYPNGATWRMSVFQFIEDKAHPKTTVTYVNERPMLQYNFLVTGQCVGQPYCKQRN